MFILRLDDASEYMKLANWERMEQLCDAYHIRPIVGIIPKCEDEKLQKYGFVKDFWEIVRRHKTKGYTLALHGYSHVFETACGGLNPVNRKSEFAGMSLDRQKDKIKNGIAILNAHGIEPKVFFAPAHTFDENTLEALRECSSIRIISDTIANDCYYRDGFFFVPQQSGRVRNVRFRTATFCYHPNTMKTADYEELEAFFKRNGDRFVSLEDLKLEKRSLSFYDRALRWIYFTKRKLR